MTIDDAEKEATAMIEGRRAVNNGDYAIVEDGDEISYYVRRKKKWRTDKDIEGNSLDETFCNLQNNCLRMKETCGDTPLNKSEVNKDLLKQISKQFDSTYSIAIEELQDMLEANLQLYEYKIEKLKWLQEEDVLKYDKQRLNSIEMVFEEREPSTLQTRLRDIILAQSDFVKKQTTIRKFVDIYCKVDPTSPYWFLCKETEMKLLPTFFKKLADAYFNKNYQIKLNEIKQEQGTMGDDNGVWVDKHSGYVISTIDYDIDEGYTESGFKQVSRYAMEKELSDALLKTNSTSRKKIY